MIDRFQGPFRFLSNFQLCIVEFEGIIFPSTENAYQAAKTLDLKKRMRMVGMTPGQAKAAGGEIKARGELRPDWDKVNLQIMKQLNKQKFTNHISLGAALIATGDQEIVEGNTWHDNFWGDCSCLKCITIEKDNHLGKILMEIREELRQDAIRASQ